MSEEQEVFSLREAIDRLHAIKEMAQNHMSKDILSSTHSLLSNIVDICNRVEPASKMKKPPLDHIIISCDASIKKNPGGPAAVGIVIQTPPINGKTKTEDYLFSQIVTAETNNEAEYDAVYIGLTALLNIINNPRYEIEIRTDSMLVARQLTGEWECNNEKLKEKRDIILELIGKISSPVFIEWRPRNSTPQLETANNIAQNLIDVPNH